MATTKTKTVKKPAATRTKGKTAQAPVAAAPRNRAAKPGTPARPVQAKKPAGATVVKQPAKATKVSVNDGSKLTAADREKHTKLFLKLAARKGGISRPAFQAQAGITEGQARGITEAARKANQVEMVGNAPKDRVYKLLPNPASN